MAVIKLQAPLSELRGTIGGVTYSVNGATRYAKAWGYPVRRRTDAQSLNRVSFSNAALAWKSLTDEQRTAWGSLAADPPEPDYNRFGELIYLTGLQWFTRCNTRLLTVGAALISDAPSQERPPSLQSPELVVQEETSPYDKYLTHSTFETEVGWYVIVEAAMTRGPSVSAVEGQYRIIMTSGNVGETQEVFTDEWDAAFPLGTAGQKGWVRVWIQDSDGLRSQAAYSSAIAS